MQEEIQNLRQAAQAAQKLREHADLKAEDEDEDEARGDAKGAGGESRRRGGERAASPERTDRPRGPGSYSSLEIPLAPKFGQKDGPNRRSTSDRSLQPPQGAGEGEGEGSGSETTAKQSKRGKEKREGAGGAAVVASHAEGEGVGDGGEARAGKSPQKAHGVAAVKSVGKKGGFESPPKAKAKVKKVKEPREEEEEGGPRVANSIHGSSLAQRRMQRKGTHEREEEGEGEGAGEKRREKGASPGSGNFLSVSGQAKVPSFPWEQMGRGALASPSRQAYLQAQAKQQQRLDGASPLATSASPHADASPTSSASSAGQRKPPVGSRKDWEALNSACAVSPLSPNAGGSPSGSGAERTKGGLEVGQLLRVGEDTVVVDKGGRLRSRRRKGSNEGEAKWGSSELMHSPRSSLLSPLGFASPLPVTVSCVQRCRACCSAVQCAHMVSSAAGRVLLSERVSRRLET